MKKVTSHFLSNVVGWILVLFLFAGIESCKPDPDDPCKDARPISAEFDILCRLYGLDSVVLPVFDTVINTIELRAKQEFDEYYWYIGKEAAPRRGPVCFVDFGLQYYDKITIKFVGKRKAANPCFPGEALSDSSTKEITVIGAAGLSASFYGIPKKSIPLYGTYYGYDERAPDKYYSFTLGRDEDCYTRPYTWFFTCAWNVIQDAQCEMDDMIVNSGRLFEFGGNGCSEQTESGLLRGLVGYGILYPDNRLIITCYYGDGNLDGSSRSVKLLTRIIARKIKYEKL
jgi:hypothetical protein